MYMVYLTYISILTLYISSDANMYTFEIVHIQNQILFKSISNNFRYFSNL